MQSCAACTHVARQSLCRPSAPTSTPSSLVRHVEQALAAITLQQVRARGGDVADDAALRRWKRLVRRMLLPEAPLPALSQNSSAQLMADSEARNRALADCTYDAQLHTSRIDHCRACHRAIAETVGIANGFLSVDALSAWLAYLSSEGEALRAADGDAYDALVNAWRWCAHEEERARRAPTAAARAPTAMERLL